MSDNAQTQPTPEQPTKRERKPHPVRDREPTYRAFVNPQGSVFVVNLVSAELERADDLVTMQRPPKTRAQDWYRDAEEQEILAYMEQSGHFFHDDDRAEWEAKKIAEVDVRDARAKKLQQALKHK